ncbi:unnamed protein product, partial [Effrenium voratum]
RASGLLLECDLLALLRRRADAATGFTAVAAATENVECGKRLGGERPGVLEHPRCCGLLEEFECVTITFESRS